MGAQAPAPPEMGSTRLPGLVCSQIAMLGGSPRRVSHQGEGTFLCKCPVSGCVTMSTPKWDDAHIHIGLRSIFLHLCAFAENCLLSICTLIQFLITTDFRVLCCCIACIYFGRLACRRYVFRFCPHPHNCRRVICFEANRVGSKRVRCKSKRFSNRRHPSPL